MSEHEFQMDLFYAEEFGTKDDVIALLKERVAELSDLEAEIEALQVELEQVYADQCGCVA